MRLYSFLFSASILILSGCGKQGTENKAAAQPAAPPTVKTAAATTRRIDRAIAVTGSLNPDETVNVSFEIAGRIAAINTDFGKSVRKGDVLAELDKQEFQLQLERSRAAMSQALARLGLNSDQDNVRPESTSTMRQAAAQMDDARFKFESAAKLVKTGDISQERYTELEKAFRARQAAYEITRDEMRVQLANLDSLRADVKLAQKKLSDATVRAPFDGAIGQKMVSPGQFIKENTTVLTLVKPNPLRLLVDIPENAAAEIGVGTTLTFTTDGIPDKQFHATVRQLNPSLDSKSRSLTAEARLNESDARLRPGMFVQVQIVVQRNAEIVVIPTGALYTVAGLTKAFVVRDNRAIEYKIPPGQVVDGLTEVPAGQIKPGDLVAVSNLPALTNGSQVSKGN